MRPKKKKNSINKQPKTCVKISVANLFRPVTLEFERKKVTCYRYVYLCFWDFLDYVALLNQALRMTNSKYWLV